jgi:hypothetical protein
MRSLHGLSFLRLLFFPLPFVLAVVVLTVSLVFLLVSNTR